MENDFPQDRCNRAALPEVLGGCSGSSRPDLQKGKVGREKRDTREDTRDGIMVREDTRGRTMVREDTREDTRVRTRTRERTTTLRTRTHRTPS